MLKIFLSGLVTINLATTTFAIEPTYQKATAKNGLDVIMMESHKVPLVTIVISAQAGGMTELPETNGLTHLWEHMFFKGNKRIPNQEAFNRRIRQLGIVYNGDTSAEKVRYYFTMPSAFLDEGIQFMADAISTPLLSQTELEKERRVVIDEYDRSAARPSFDFRNLQKSMIYGKMAYLRDPLGHRHLIEKATKDQLLQIKNDVFVPSNCALLVSGDFQPKSLMKIVNKHFSGWVDPPKWKPVKRPAFPPFPKTTEFIMTRPNARNAMLQILFRGPRVRAEPEDTFAADVLISLLEVRGGKFYKRFVDSGLTFESGLSYYTQAQAGELVLYATTKPESIALAKNKLLAEIREWLKPDYFSKMELENVRRKLEIGHKRALNKPSEYIKTVAFWWAVTGMEYYDTYLTNLRKTSLDQVRQFIRKWFIGKPLISGILLNPDDAKKTGLKDNSWPLVKQHLSEYGHIKKMMKSERSE